MIVILDVPYFFIKTAEVNDSSSLVPSRDQIFLLENMKVLLELSLRV